MKTSNLETLLSVLHPALPTKPLAVQTPHYFTGIEPYKSPKACSDMSYQSTPCTDTVGSRPGSSLSFCSLLLFSLAAVVRSNAGFVSCCCLALLLTEPSSKTDVVSS
jgi:hypothetical protein